MTTMTRDAWSDRAHERFPQGSNGEYDFPGGWSPVFVRGAGAELWDTEGRRWVDYTMAWGSALVGHAHPHLVEAIQRTASRGVNFAALSDGLVRLAERLTEARIAPWLERVRFVTSGSEATGTAIRIARGATGRRKVLKFEGAFHGSHVEGVANFIWGDRAHYPHAEPTGTGGASAVDDILVCPYNDSESFLALIDIHAPSMAAVVLDPVQRSILAEPAFVATVRAATARHRVPFILDEVVSGFRLGLGGAAAHYGVVPDLVAYGKALGGGFPIAVVGGRTDLMDEVREERHSTDRYVWAASTTGGSPLGAAAAHAVLDILQAPEAYDTLYASGTRLRAGIERVVASHGLPVVTYGCGPLVQYRLSATPVRDLATEAIADAGVRRRLDLAMVERGVFINPMLTKIYVSLAHGAAQIDAYLEALDSALSGVRPRS
ncbi:MAG: aminotransferase class III-fold pyridoxal phosphate-dependent enzyme [Vicinamibacterales bacterium]